MTPETPFQIFYRCGLALTLALAAGLVFGLYSIINFARKAV